MIRRLFISFQQIGRYVPAIRVTLWMIRVITLLNLVRAAIVQSLLLFARFVKSSFCLLITTPYVISNYEYLQMYTVLVLVLHEQSYIAIILYCCT